MDFNFIIPDEGYSRKWILTLLSLMKVIPETRRAH
jgi:hypothetical protein